MDTGSGGGAEYRHYWNTRNATGLSYEQNSWDGKLEALFATEKGTTIRPPIGYEFSVLETEKFNPNGNK